MSKNIWNHIPFLVIAVVISVMITTNGILTFVVPTIMVYWAVGLNLESDYRECEWAANANSSNPLYERGHIRKKTSRIGLLSNLKAFWFCRITSLCFLFILIIYGIFRYWNNMEPNIWFEWMMTLGLAFLFGIWLIFRIYYKWRYREDFRYVENQEGIWKPFSYILQYTLWSGKQSYLYRYDVGYENVRETIEESCLKNGYCFSSNNSLNDSDEIIFLTRQKHNMLDIFSLILVEKLEADSWEKFNVAFAEYWKTSINTSITVENAGITFLVCVKERSRELRKKTDLRYGVDQKKGRYRLPAILDCDDSLLTVSHNLYSRHGQKQYNQMHQELLEMLGINE